MPPSRLQRTIPVWNRKLHFYTGLYLLFFLWLFALSGLSLNRSTWSWLKPAHHTETSERAFGAFLPEDDYGAARAVMTAFGLRGEIHQTERTEGGGVFKVWVTQPNRLFIVTVDRSSGNALVERRERNFWGVLQGLHLFNAVSVDDPERRRDWIWTTVWTLSMDALALGVVFLVVSGVYMWWVQNPKKRLSGAVALFAGTLSALWFLIGLRLFS